MNKVVICPRCKRTYSVGTVICECGEMLGGIEPILEDKILAKERSVSGHATHKYQNKAAASNTLKAQTPMLSLIFYMLGVLSFIGGVTMANDDSLTFISPVYWVVAGFVQAALFAFMGSVLFYLNEIYRK